MATGAPVASAPGRAGLAAPAPAKPEGHAKRLVVAAVVVVVLTAAIALGSYLIVRTDGPPASSTAAHASTVPLAQQIVGFWKGRDAALPESLVFHADGTVQRVVQSEDLFSRNEARAGRYSVTGDTLVLSGSTIGSRCDHAFAVERLVQGWIRLTQVRPPSSSACVGEQPIVPFTLVRLSPTSQAGLAYPSLPSTGLAPLRTTNPLHGTWLLAGTGLMLVVSRTGPPPAVAYRLDGRGTLDTDAQDGGSLTVVDPGRLVLSGNDPRACGDTVLRSVAAGDYVVTARVESDPCRRFAGETALTWLLIQ